MLREEEDLDEALSETPRDSTVWVTPCWSEWRPGGHSSREIDQSRAARPYSHWHLAVELTAEGADDVRLGTAIQKLWNAVESRTRLLQEEYRLGELKKVFGWTRGKPDVLEVLARLDLARPIVLRELKDIRNVVEHADRGVPSRDQCLRYVDSVWYFLRSTDIFASRRILSFDLDGDPNQADMSSQPFVEFTFEETNWSPKVRGWFPEASVNTMPIANAIQVHIERPVRRGGVDLVYLSGIAAANATMVDSIIRDYFFVDLPDSRRFLGGVESAAPEIDRSGT